MSEQIDDKGTPVEPEYTPTEQKALEQGWRPKSEWDGDEDDFIDAKEFVRRGELFSKIDHQNKELKQLKAAMEQFKDHHAKVEQVAYDKAIADLKAQRKAALAEGDVDRFDELDQKVDDLTEERAEFVQTQREQAKAPQGPAPEFVAWVNANPWYTKDPMMAGAADRIGIQLAQQGLSPVEVLKEVEKRIKQEFKHKFENPNRQRAGAVEAPRNTGGKTKSGYVPSEDERRIARNFVRTGAFKTEAEYYAELEKMEKGA